MSKWCINHEKELPDFSFYPNAPEKALCKDCVSKRIRKRNNNVIISSERRKREQEAVAHVVGNLQQNEESYVYLIEHQNNYKVGYSKNVAKRVRSFNTSHAVPCRIIGVAPGDRSLEKELHEKFSLHRIRGEWFLKKPVILKEFGTLPNVKMFLPGKLKQEEPSS